MKILIVSHNSFSQTHNNGKTLSAIFSAFKKEELCQLYFTPIGRPDFSRCENYYLITDKDAIRSVIFRKKCGSPSIHSEQTTSDGVRRIKPDQASRFMRTIVWALSSWYSGGLDKWIAEQRPEIIFYVGGDGVFSHRIAYSLSEKLGIPLASYFTDDYIINPPTNSYNKLLKHYFKRTIKKSSLLYAIGEQMASRYSDYFNRPFSAIMNIVDIPVVEPEYNPHANSIKINYFGGLHVGRAEEIIKFAEFLHEKVIPLLKKKVIIGVYTFADLSHEVLDKYTHLGIVVNKPLVGDELDEAMRDADLFLHVESSEPQFKKLTMLSVSTKIPEYMCKMRPIIAFGPKEVASFGVIEKAEPELLIDYNHNLNERAVEIAELLNDEEKLISIARRGFEFAKQHFDKNIVANQFRTELDDLHNKHDNIRNNNDNC